MGELSYFQKIPTWFFSQPLLLRLIYPFLIVVILFCLLFYYFFLRAPENYPVGIIYTIEKGSNLSTVSSDLKKKDIIRSSFIFKVYFKAFYGSTDVHFGDYSLDKKSGTLMIARRLARGDFQLKTVKITIREGLNNKEIASLVEEKFFKITAAEFLQWAKRYEGRLFPDTYLWPINESASEAVTAMKLSFDKQAKDLIQKAAVAKKDFNDVLKMASIIELEANNDIDRHIISGIFWKRLSIGMPLQANSTLKYIDVKNTFVLSTDDTKIDSPYNTYLYKGLPPTPVCNPGLSSIEASLNPTKTEYLYFLTGRDGKMYYAKSYAEHLANKAKYLK